MIFFRKQLLTIGTFLFTAVMSTNGCDASTLLTPEGYTKHITLQPATTILVENDSPAAALQQLNKLHGDMAEDGWELYSVFEFVDDEDFEGFFVTYKKKSN